LLNTLEGRLCRGTHREDINSKEFYRSSAKRALSECTGCIEEEELWFEFREEDKIPVGLCGSSAKRELRRCQSA
jgi:hypothetical protein